MPSEIERRPVRLKSDFVKRYALGEFGNASPTWLKIDDFRKELLARKTIPKRTIDADPFGVTYSLRSSKPTDKTLYNLRPWHCLQQWLEKENLGEVGWYASEMSPHHLNVLQGELERTHEGLVLFYSTEVGLTMKDILKGRGKQVRGLSANMILKTLLPTNDLEWIEFLLEAYPSHVVEFSSFSKCWGTVNGSRTVIWEVRQY